MQRERECHENHENLCRLCHHNTVHGCWLSESLRRFWAAVYQTTVDWLVVLESLDDGKAESKAKILDNIYIIHNTKDISFGLGRDEQQQQQEVLPGRSFPKN